MIRKVNLHMFSVNESFLVNSSGPCWLNPGKCNLIGVRGQLYMKLHSTLPGNFHSLNVDKNSLLSWRFQLPEIYGGFSDGHIDRRVCMKKSLLISSDFDLRDSVKECGLLTQRLPGLLFEQCYSWRNTWPCWQGDALIEVKRWKQRSGENWVLP